MSEKHASRRRGEVGRSCLLFSEAGRWYLYEFRIKRDSCTLCAGVSEDGEKGNEKERKSKSSRRQTARRRTRMGPVFILKSTNVWLVLRESGRDIEETAM